MKRAILKLLGLLFCVSVFAFASPAVFAEDGEWGKLIWELDDKGVLTISGEGEMPAFPATVTTNEEGISYTIYADDAWRAYKYKIKAAVIENGVTSISEGAFDNCIYMTSLTIPASVKSIGNRAYSYGLNAVRISDVAAWCGITFGSVQEHMFFANPLTYAHNLYLNGTLVTDLVIPEGVTCISDAAFANCTSLTSVTIPEGVTSIGQYAFYGCTGLTSVTIPSSVTSIDDWAFLGCENLNAVHISDVAAWCKIAFGSTQYAGLSTNPLSSAHNLYLNGTLVTDLVIPEGVDNISDWAFINCTGLTSVTIQEGVTSIGEMTFIGCTNLTSVTIPSSMTSIGVGAFWGSGLTDVTIPSSVTSIGYSAFGGCTSLTSIEVDEANPTYCDLDGVLFNKGQTEIITYPAGRTGAYAIPGSVTSIEKSAFNASAGLTDVSIPSGVTKISESAFNNCTGLTSVTIPVGVTSIGQYAFSGCTALNNVHYGGTVTQWGAITVGESNEALQNAVILYNFVPDLVLPEGLTRIDPEAFAGGAFIFVKLPERAVFIGANAFADCPNLKYIYIPAETTDTDIDPNAFGGRTELTIVGIPGSAAESYADSHGFTFIPGS